MFKPDSSTELLSCENFIIGGIPDFPFSSKDITIEPNSILYIYSDGTYEIEKPDGKMWEVDDLVNYLKENKSDNEIDELYSFVQKLSGKKILDDDFSMLKILFK